MIDIRRLLTELIEVITRSDFPELDSLANILSLDISQARITNAKSGMGISGARVRRSTTEVGVVCGIIPRREIWFFLDNCSIPYRDLKDEIFGADQRIVPSKLSTGFGVLFEIDGWTCGYTASSPDGDVNSFFCEEPKQALAS